MSNSVKSVGMEVDNEDGSACFGTTEQGMPTFQISLHPLVIMNVSEHWTRIRAQNEGGEKSKVRVFGALIGKQKERDIEIMNSFELIVDTIQKELFLTKSYYENKEQQFKQVFPDLDFLGWYTNGEEPTQDEMFLHYQMMDIHDSPLLLKLNPLTLQSGLPIKIYETVTDPQKGIKSTMFLDVPYTVVTEEAERIGLDHMARLSSITESGDKTVSAVVEHLRVQYNAVKMLRERIKLLNEFVKEANAQKLGRNNEIMRTILNLTVRMSFLNADIFHQDFYTQCNDVALINHLGTITKCTNILNQFVNKFNITIERHLNHHRRLKAL